MPPPCVTAADVVALTPRLRRHAAALAGSLSDGDDLAQDCLERALGNLAAVREPQALYGWMLAILHNLHAGGFRRRRARGVEVALEDLADTVALSVAPAERTAMRDLVRALAALSDDQRQVILLTALEGMSYREIAVVLDAPIGTVMSRLARGRERLRALLEGGPEQAVRRIK
jgi:RNA polymerase sigma factor (sigma-70 family)